VELQKSVCNDVVDSIRSGYFRAAEDANDAALEGVTTTEDDESRSHINNM
jgi:hypothetical protein